MYRAMTWALQRREVHVNDAEQVARACTEVRIESGTDPLQPVVCADGIDVTGQIRSDEVTGAVSAVSAVPRVREEQIGRAACRGRVGGTGGDGVGKKRR